MPAKIPYIMPHEYEHMLKVTAGTIERCASELARFFGIEGETGIKNLENCIKTKSYIPEASLLTTTKDLSDVLKEFAGHEMKSAAACTPEQTIVLDASYTFTGNLSDDVREGSGADGIEFVPIIGEEVMHALYSAKHGITNDHTESEFFGRIGFLYFARKLGIPYDKFDKGAFVTMVNDLDSKYGGCVELEKFVDAKIQEMRNELTPAKVFESRMQTLYELVDKGSYSLAAAQLGDFFKESKLPPISVARIELSIAFHSLRYLPQSSDTEADGKKRVLENIKNAASGYATDLSLYITSLSAHATIQSEAIKMILDDLANHLPYFLANRYFGRIEQMQPHERRELLEKPEIIKSWIVSDKELMEILKSFEQEKTGEPNAV